MAAVNHRVVGWTKDDGTDREVHCFEVDGEGRYIVGYNADVFSWEEVRDLLVSKNMALEPRTPWWRRVARAIIG